MVEAAPVPDLIAAADLAIRALIAQLAPQAIVWFGSVANGHARADSDLDFLIIASRQSGSRQALLRRARRAVWELRVPIDFLLYYPDEVAQRRTIVGHVVEGALRTGKVVHGAI